MSHASTAAWVGMRVRLVRMADPYTNLKPGALGRITMVDDGLTFHVKWDNGSTLGLIPGVDLWDVVADESGLVKRLGFGECRVVGCKFPVDTTVAPLRFCTEHLADARRMMAPVDHPRVDLDGFTEGY